MVIPSSSATSRSRTPTCGHGRTRVHGDAEAQLRGIRPRGARPCARPGCDHRSIVEQRPRIEDREHFGMGMTDHFTITVRQSREN